MRQHRLPKLSYRGNPHRQYTGVVQSDDSSARPPHLIHVTRTGGTKVPSVSTFIAAISGRWTARLGVSTIRKSDGATLVETAMVSAILFALLFGLIQIGYAFYTYNFVSDAAREAARYASVR